MYTCTYHELYIYAHLCVCACTYVHMYLLMHVHTFSNTHKFDAFSWGITLYIFTCIHCTLQHVFVYMYIHLGIHLHIMCGVCVCVHVCACVYTCVCVWVCVNYFSLVHMNEVMPRKLPSFLVDHEHQHTIPNLFSYTDSYCSTFIYLHIFPPFISTLS